MKRSSLRLWLGGLVLCMMSFATLTAHAQITVPSSSPTTFWNGIFTDSSTWPNGTPNTPPLTIMYGLRIGPPNGWADIELQRGGAITNSAYWDWTNIDMYTGLGASDLLLTFFKVPLWANDGGSNADPPSDLTTSSTCETPLAGTVTSDCQYKEFVTAVMQHTCGVTSQPSQPLVGQCKIKNFESWNEFNSSGYWNDTYADLAIMAEDAAHIVRLYCGDCLFGAGSTAGAGAAYSPPNGGDSYYDTALETFLTAWKSSSEPAPDFISWHPAATRSQDGAGGALTPAPMPETDISGDGSGSGGDNGDASCTTSNSGRSNVYCGDSVDTQAQNMTAIVNTSTYGVDGKPVWATEGGYGQDANLQNSDNNDTNSDPSTCHHAPCYQDQLRGSYMARWWTILRWRGIQRTWLYSWDDPCYRGIYMENLDVNGSEVMKNSCTYLGHTETFNTGVLLQPGIEWESLQAWLNGATRPICTKTASGSGYIYTCTLTRTNPSNYHAVIAWYTGWLGSVNFTPTPPSGEHYTQYRTLPGVEHSYSSGSVTLNWEPLIFEGVN